MPSPLGCDASSSLDRRGNWAKRRASEDEEDEEEEGGDEARGVAKSRLVRIQCAFHTQQVRLPALVRVLCLCMTGEILSRWRATCNLTCNCGETRMLMKRTSVISNQSFMENLHDILPLGNTEIYVGHITVPDP